MAELNGVHVLVVEDTDDSREMRPMPSQAGHVGSRGRRRIECESVASDPQARASRGRRAEDTRWTSPFLPVTTFAC